MKDLQKNIHKLSHTRAKTMTIYFVRLCYVRRSWHSRDCGLITLGKLVVARIKVRLAFGETNNIRPITRSVIGFNMRKQSLSTLVRDIGRTFMQTFNIATAHVLISIHQDIITDETN